MASSKPSIVIVPGLLHVPEHFQKLTDILERDGYRVVCVRVLVPGDNNTLTGTDGNMKLIRQAVEHEIELGNDVLFVAHSASGIVGPASIKDLDKKNGRPGIKRILGISALVLLSGEGVSALKVLMGRPVFFYEPKGNVLQALPFDHPGERSPEPGVYSVSPVTACYNDMTPSQQKEAYDLLVPTYIDIVTTKFEYCGWQHFPSTYIICDNDNLNLPATQERLIKRACSTVEFLHIDAGHSPFISKPDKLAALIEQAAMSP